MEDEKWLIEPGEQRVIDLVGVRRVKVSLVGGQVDVVGHDGDEVRVEVHRVERKDLRVTVENGLLHIDHPQLKWGSFIESMRRFSFDAMRAEVSVAVPRSIPLTLGVVNAEALVTDLAADVDVNTVSGPVVVDGIIGDIDVNTVSGEVQLRDVHGRFDGNSVSGDITVSGELRRTRVKTVSGAVIVDASGPVDLISTSTVSGNATMRIDEGRPANLLMRTAGGGSIQVDGFIAASGKPANYAARLGELSGSFADITNNTVSGDIVLVRRASAEAAQTGAEA